jgi:hypothetical protein
LLWDFEFFIVISNIQSKQGSLHKIYQQSVRVTCLGCLVKTDLCLLPCSSYLVPAVLSCVSCQSCPVAVVMSRLWLFWLAILTRLKQLAKAVHALFVFVLSFQTLLSWLSYHGCPVPIALLSCSGCPPLSVLSWWLVRTVLSCVLSRLSWPGYPLQAPLLCCSFCHVLAISVLSQQSCSRCLVMVVLSLPSCSCSPVLAVICCPS